VELNFRSDSSSFGCDFPDFEFRLVEAGCHKVANFRIWLGAFATNQIGRFLQFYYLRDASLRLRVSVNVLNNFTSINIPHFNFAFQSADKKEVLIDLK